MTSRNPHNAGYGTGSTSSLKEDAHPRMIPIYVGSHLLVFPRPRARARAQADPISRRVLGNAPSDR